MTATFSAPGSPTSGLQGYDLEGARALRRKRRRRITSTKNLGGDGPLEQEPDTMSKDRMKVFVPITKIDAEKGIVYGVLAAEEKDRVGETFDYKGSKPYFEKWSQGISKATGGKSLGNLRAMHGQVAAGKFTDLVFNDDEQKIEVAAKIIDKNELEKALEGVYTGFSIGGRYVSRKKDGDTMRYVCDPVEGSLVDLPCIRSATFDIVKADGATLQKNFNPAGDVEAKARELCKAAAEALPADKVDDKGIDAHVEKNWASFEDEAIEALAKEAEAEIVEPTNDDIAAKARELATAAGDATKWLDHIPAAREELVKAAKPKPEQKPTHGATGSDDGTEKQVWTHKALPGQTFDTKADMRKALVAKDAADAADKVAKPAADALADLKKLLDTSTGPLTVEKLIAQNFDAVDEALRKSIGATAEQWAAANAFAKKLPSGDPILVAISKLPAIATDVEKKTLTVDAVTVEGLRAFIAKAEADAKEEADDKKKKKDEKKGKFPFDREKKDPEKLSAAMLRKVAAGDLAKGASLYSVANLVQILASVQSAEESLEASSYGYGSQVPKELCDRFGVALVEFGEIVLAVLTHLVNEMRDGEADEIVNRVYAAAEVTKCAVGKYGARNATIDKARLKKAHDLLAEVEPAVCADEDSEKTEAAELQKRLDATTNAFQKRFDELVPLIAEVAKTVKQIADTPLPGPTPGGYRILEKNGGGGSEIDAAKTSFNAEVFSAMRGIEARRSAI